MLGTVIWVQGGSDVCVIEQLLLHCMWVRRNLQKDWHVMPKNALFSFKMCHTNGEYERIGVHCIYAKKAFLVSTRQNLKFKFFFWGHGPQTFTRMWPWTPLGTSVPKTPWNPEPVQTLKPSYTPEHSTECCLKLHAGFKMCLYVIVATAAAPCGCLEVAGCCCWYRYFKQI